MGFDLTSTQEASHTFTHPEMTKCTFSIELNFDIGLANLLFMGESASTVYVRSDRKFTRFTLMT